MRRRGAILVVALAVLAGLIAILASAAATHQLFVQAEANRLETDRARLAAMSGIQHGLQALYAQIQTQSSGGGTSSSGTTSQSGATTTQDDWAKFGNFGDDKFVTGNSSFRVQIVDLAGMININTATQEQLQRLPLTSEQIDSLLDFREAGTDARPEGGKDQYYNQLPNPYNAKLRGFDTFDELLQVKGFTPSVLYTPQTDVISSTQVTPSNEEQPALVDIVTTYSFSPENNPQGQAKINVNAGNAAQRLPRLLQLGLQPQIATVISNQNWPTLGSLLQQVPGLSVDQQKIILDNCTTSAAPRVQGKINLNTATESVLNSVPGMTNDIAQAIIQQQSQGFASLGDLLNVPGVSGDALAMVDYFTVSSQTFLVRSVGTSGSATVALQAIIDVQNNTPKIIQIQEPPYTDYAVRWGWQDEPSTETVLKEAK
jgi:general secretion pathway protein K